MIARSPSAWFAEAKRNVFTRLFSRERSLPVSETAAFHMADSDNRKKRI